MLTINGVELEFDMLDVDTFGAYTEAGEQLKAKTAEIEEAQKDKNVFQAFRLTCEAINAFFDHIFGEGTSEELFGSRMNFRTSIEAYKVLKDEAEKQLKEQAELTRELFADKDSGNRTRLRAALKK